MPNESSNTPGSDEASDLVNLKILANGNALNNEYGILTVETTRHFNKIAAAKITITDGDASEKNFKISSTDDALTPGKDIEIQMGYHAEAKTIFKGIIINHAIKSGKNKHSTLTIEAKDKAFILSIGRNNQCFIDQSDSDIISSIVQKVSLQSDIAETSLKHKEMVQYNSTNWDFIVSRAEMNGLLVLTDDNKLVMLKPDTSQGEAKEIIYGTDVIEFETEINGRSQLSEVKGFVWNYHDQKIEESPEATVQYTEAGNLTAESIANAIGLKKFNLVHTGNISDEEVKLWGNAQLLKSRMAKIQGRVKIKGLSEIKPGQVIKLTGFSQRFNGKVLVTGIEHHYTKAIWETEIHFGQDDQWIYQREDVIQKPAGGIVPGVNGLQIGIVQQLENDPNNQDMIKIRLPTVDSNESLWARMATLDAGKERGSFFRPEINDEVLVGFINDDPRYPIVLGMLNSGKLPAPLKGQDANDEKGFVTRSKMKLIFNDDKKSIHIETPGKKTVDIDDDGDKIVIADQHNNKVTLSPSGIEMVSGKDISIKAASGNITLEAINIENKANAKFSAKGNASAEVQSSGQTVVKGMMVMIN